MNDVCRAIFKAIHEGKWMSIVYRNKNNEQTRYWIAVKDININYKALVVRGFHLGTYQIKNLNIYIDSIETGEVIDGSYFPINKRLIDDIELNPKKYAKIFDHTVNLRILNYLEDCYKFDTLPYITNYSLISSIDRDTFADEKKKYRLSRSQFEEIVANFETVAKNYTKQKRIRVLAINVLSLNTERGLCLLAYRRLLLDVEQHCLIPADEISVCEEYTMEGYKQSIRKYLDAEDYCLLKDFEANQEIIKDKLTGLNNRKSFVNDMPYILELTFDYNLDLRTEYRAITKMYSRGNATDPIRAFFGELLQRPHRRRTIPIALINKRVNLDQLLAVNTAMKYPVAYIQGPPGTGKTSTIVNTIITAFFNEKTVLLTSYNNHPVDGVFDTLSSMEYNGVQIPFPIIRLGNNEKLSEALKYMDWLMSYVAEIDVPGKTLDKNRSDRIERSKKLGELLKQYDEVLDLRERKDTIEKLSSNSSSFEFKMELQSRQLYEINKRLKEIGEITTEEALNLLNDDEQEFKKYLFYVSAKYIKRIFEPKNSDLRDIIVIESESKRIKEFKDFLSDDDNLRRFMRIFPVIATTNISAAGLGKPEPHFDMTIMDEASQCNTAVSLVPIIRGESLMLVGDPQQLNPVIVISPAVNEKLKKKYHIRNEYDYISNSIYKVFLANDAVSDEILLSYHYRCHKKIIEFNNKKYYNNKLVIKTECNTDKPLVFIDIKGETTNYKNTAPDEAERIVKYAAAHREESIGVVTPFVNQREFIIRLVKEHGLDNVSCGTVHAFQGDEKDVIMFSLALTDKTGINTYNWLKNNKELINVATSRARNRLIVLSCSDQLNRLHTDEDDIYELVSYVQSDGETVVTPKVFSSRALGIKPYSTETEEDFLKNLNHAISNILLNGIKCVVHKEVPISQVFLNNDTYDSLFYTGRFDFVVYEKSVDKKELPLLAIELDGREHFGDSIVKKRDMIKNNICREHGFELIRVENSYARRYNYIKDILINYFTRISGVR